MHRLLKQVNKSRQLHCVVKERVSIRMKEVDSQKTLWRLQSSSIKTEEDERSFTLSGRNTFFDLEEQLLLNLHRINEIKFIDYDNSRIASTNTLESIGYMFRVLVDGVEVNIANDSVQKQKEYQSMEQFTDDIQLPLLQKRIVLGYLKKVDLVLHNKHGVKAFDDNYLTQAQPVTKDSLYLAFLEGLISRTGINKTNENKLFQSYQETLDQVEQLKEQYENLQNDANNMAKRKLSIGLFALIGQLYLAGYGTYVAYSWDIMEPIIYFVNLSFTIGFSYQFFKLKGACTPETFYEYLKNREVQKIANRNGFDLEAYQALKKKLNQLETKIKMNVIGTQ